jgi:hypothetical protein
MFLKTVKAEHLTTRATDGYHSMEPRAQPTVRKFLKTVKAEHVATRAIGGFHRWNLEPSHLSPCF